jgi:Fe-S-cluster-containing hydrogenase component 2
MLKRTGVATSEDIKSVMPSAERLSKGPVAIIECFQKIPCNPCTKACSFGAIQPMDDINDLPTIDFDKCNGCAVCVSRCPGLAIVVVDATYSETEALIKLPWEFTPLPVVGTVVKTMDRSGEIVGEGRIIKVQDGAFFDKTRILHVVVPKDDIMIVRSIDRRSY